MENIEKAHPNDHLVNKPFGEVVHYPEPEPRMDPRTGKVIAQPARAINPKLAAAMKLKTYQPCDEIRTQVIFIEHNSQPSTVSFTVIIPAAQCSSSMDPQIVGKELIVGFTCLASNMALDPSLNTVFSTADDGSEHCAVSTSEIPLIVRLTKGHKFNEIKDSIRRIDFIIDNSNGQIKQHNLLNNHDWTGPAKRAIDAMRVMVDMREQFSLECWTQLDNHRTLEGAIRRISARFAVDRNQPSIWQQMHTKKLEVHDDTVFFNHGNIKKYGDRPYTETFQSIGYHNQMEMNTRLAVSFLEVKEDRARNAMKLCVLGGVIRPLELLGAGDMSYLGLLKINPIAEEEAAKLNIRFDEGDVLKINFKTDPRDIVDDGLHHLQTLCLELARRDYWPTCSTSREITAKC